MIDTVEDLIVLYYIYILYYMPCLSRTIDYVSAVVMRYGVRSIVSNMNIGLRLYCTVTNCTVQQ